MRGIAVCCGFNDYEFNPLNRALNDAAILYAKLTETETFGAPDLIGAGELFTQHTTADAILGALGRAATSAADLVWFSFSGHAIIAPDGELRLLLPGWRHDGGEDDRRTYSIGARQLTQVLRSRLTRKRFVVVLDACHSGAFGQGVRTRDLAPALGQQIANAGTVVISSCASDQHASDGADGSAEPTGAFTTAVVRVLDNHARAGASLSVLQLFLEAKARIDNGQRPTLYVNGLTDDFPILAAGGAAGVGDGIVPMFAGVPAGLKTKLSTLLDSLVQIRRQRRVGLVHAERQLDRLVAEFYCYGDDTFVVPAHNSNVAEAFDNARRCIIGCTTPAYIASTAVGGLGLMGGMREFIARQHGRAVQFFFMPGDFERRVPGVLDVVRAHVAAGVLVVIVDVDSFGPAVLQEVFKDPRPRDLSSLECTFVDGKVFLKSHFAANGELKVEVDQRPDRSQHEYKAQLLPFLSSAKGVLLGASLHGGGDGIALDPLECVDVCELRKQLETDLGVAA